MEDSQLRKIYDNLERTVLIMIAIPIPFFGFVYLNSESPIFFFNVPQLPGFWEYFGLGTVFTLLLAQFVVFQKESKGIVNSNYDLPIKLHSYSKASFKRFGLLLVAALISALGLFLFENPGYTVSFAIALLFFSVAKPSPDRIIRSLKLVGEEKELVNGLKRRG
ncbi:hypothetical protein MMU05_15680 [Aquiflexum sp. AIY15W]|nr:hypothetical protein [Cognataquiflexum rubidum]